MSSGGLMQLVQLGAQDLMLMSDQSNFNHHHIEFLQEDYTEGPEDYTEGPKEWHIRGCISEERIRKRAYQIWKNTNCDDAVANWFKAKRELEEEAPW